MAAGTDFDHCSQAFRKILNDHTTFAIGYHPDADGMSAAAILIKYLLAHGKKRENLFLYPTNASSPINRLLYPEQEADVLDKAPDVFLYVDLANFIPDQIKKIKKKVRFTVSVDHHNFKPDWPGEFDLYINPALFEGLVHPNNLVAARLMGLLLDMNNCDWLSILGFAGDNIVEAISSTIACELTELLNLLGTAEHPGEQLQTQSQRTNRILDLLVQAKTPVEFKNLFSTHKDLVVLYQSLVEDVLQTIRSVAKSPSQIAQDNHSLFYYSIQSLTGFNIGGTVLKKHVLQLGFQDTVILDQDLGQGRHQIHIYSSDPFVNCYTIVMAYGGGGHVSKAGFTYYDRVPQAALDEIVEKFKTMIEKDVEL